MEEITKDFLEQQEELGLLARTGRTRPLSKPGLPTYKEWAAQNGPVVTKALPTLPTTAARLRWLKARDDLTNAELAQKTSISVSTIQRIFTGGGVRASTLREIAKSFDVPPDWLTGSVDQPPKNQEPVNQSVPVTKKEILPAQNNHPSPKFHFELSANGEYTGAELRELLGCLVENMRYSIQLNVRAQAKP